MLPKNLASLPVTAHPNKNIFLNNLPFWKEVVNFFPPLCFILLVDILVLLCVFNDPTLVEVVCAYTVKWSCQFVSIKSSIIFWTDSIFCIWQIRFDQIRLLILISTYSILFDSGKNWKLEVQLYVPERETIAYKCLLIRAVR